VINRYLKPFSGAQDDVGLDFIAHCAQMTTCRHLCDAETISDGTIALLDHCLERLLSDRSFDPNGYRAGEVYGCELPRSNTIL
jgi:hypothetical protein